MSSQDPVVIVSAARTPMGGFQGNLSKFSATELGAAATRAAVDRTKLSPEQIDEVVMGCVLSAGLGQAPARQVALGAGLSRSTVCSLVNKVCGSGMKAVMNARESLLAEACEIVVAGGMESMTNAPYLLKKARAGFRLGHGEVIDHMFLDGLEDPFDHGCSMGAFAEDSAQDFQFTREDQDAYAIESLRRANAAVASGAFKDEIVSLDDVDTDEQPGKARIDRIAQLRPAFREGGTVTAASSASISDGGAAMVLLRESIALKLRQEPLARIVGTANFANTPSQFATAPIHSIRKLFDKTGWTADAVDLFEINEAFAVVVMATMRELDLAHEKVNIFGGACALGHPIGCSGTRIIVTLLSALKANKLKRGIASLCIGGGEATSIALEVY